MLPMRAGLSAVLLRFYSGALAAPFQLGVSENRGYPLFGVLIIRILLFLKYYIRVPDFGKTPKLITRKCPPSRVSSVRPGGLQRRALDLLASFWGFPKVGGP